MLAPYLPAQGIVLVDGKENEIVTARTVLSLIEVRGRIVTGDVMFAQRDLSRQIRRTGGDYPWCVKENQEARSDEIATLFTFPPLPALPDDFTTATSLDTAHGRYQERPLQASSLLAGYTTWPADKQVFQLRRHTLMADGGLAGEYRLGDHQSALHGGRRRTRAGVGARALGDRK